MDYVRYLQSKETVDDRALNLRVLLEFEAYVQQRSSVINANELRFVEVGGGVGSTFMRLLRRKTIFSTSARVEYSIVDIKREVLEAARNTISSEAPVILKSAATREQNSETSSTCGAVLVHPQISGPGGVHNSGTVDKRPSEVFRLGLTEQLTVNFILGDAIHFLSTQKAKFDVLIGAAVMDLWEPEPTLSVLSSALDKDRGIACFYLPINFDGTTDFFPVSCEGADFDSRVERSFHSSMGRRAVCNQETLACHTGRRLIPVLRKLKMTLKSAGGSTWIVSPDEFNTYQGDEAYFVECILDFIQYTAEQHDDPLATENRAAFQRYMKDRRQQLSKKQLVYVAHNIDFFGVVERAER